MISGALALGGLYPIHAQDSINDPSSIVGAPFVAPADQTLRETLADVRIKRDKEYIDQVAPAPDSQSKNAAGKGSSGIIVAPGTKFSFVPQGATQPAATQGPAGMQPPVQAQKPQPPVPQKKIKFNFQNADAVAVVNFMAKLYNLVPITSGLAGQQISISTPGEVPLDKAYSIFTAIINNMNFSVVTTEHYMQVVPKSSAMQYPLKIFYGEDPDLLPDTDEMVTVLVPCKNMSATDMQKYVVPITSYGIGANNVNVDQSANLLIISDISSNIKRIIKMIRYLDVPGLQKFTNLETSVYYINYMNAKDLAECLNNAFKIQSTVTVKDGTVENNQIIIQPFPDANAILVTALPSLQTAVGAAIKNLDKRKKQVLLKVKLIEATHSRNYDLGSNFSFNDGSNSLALGPTSSSTTTTNILPDSTTSPQFSYVYNSSKVDFAIQSLLAKVKAKLLSQPKLLTSDNQKALLIVGQQEPILKSTTTVDTTGNGNVVSDYSYLDIGIKLTITPHINPGNDVTLAMDLKISDILDRINVGGQQVPELTNRQIQTTATVQHDHTLVIGGIISQNHTDTQTSLPILADIPLIGWMFGQDADEHTQTELIILISPVVIDQTESADKLTDEEKKSITVSEKDFEHFEKYFNEAEDSEGKDSFGDKFREFVNPRDNKPKQEENQANPNKDVIDEKDVLEELPPGELPY